MVGRTAVIVLGVVAGRGIARADAPVFGPPVTNRNYAIELYQNGAIGDDTVIAMGGAAVANSFGSSGTLVNPSASAVRQTTDNDRWGWDYHLGYLNSTLSTDYDNTGVTSAEAGTSAFTGGLALRIGDWAIAGTLTYETTNISDTMPLVAEVQQGKLALARWFPRLELALGVALELDSFQLHPAGNANDQLFSINGSGLEAGATWIPHGESFRLGGEAASPIHGANVVAGGCGDPANCDGYILPDEVVSAWHVAAGAAYRWAPTAWNQQIHAAWRDERALTAVADLVIAGSVANAYGLEAFGQHELQRSGEHAAYSLRGGVEYEWLPGRLRLRGGSYWEPGRYNDVGGRVHGTFGLEVRAFEFWLFGPRRGQLTLTGDVAARYDNVGLSIGFWH